MLKVRVAALGKKFAPRVEPEQLVTHIKFSPKVEAGVAEQVSTHSMLCCESAKYDPVQLSTQYPVRGSPYYGMSPVLLLRHVATHNFVSFCLKPLEQVREQV